MWKWTRRIVPLVLAILWYCESFTLVAKTVVIPAAPDICCPIVELRLFKSRIYFQTGDLGTLIEVGSAHTGTGFDFRALRFRSYNSKEGYPLQ